MGQGDVNPASAGKKAAKLYDKRSELVHSGKSISLSDLLELRTIVREALAVQADCYEHIRERYPTS